MSGAVKRARFLYDIECFPYKYLRVTYAVLALMYLFTILLLSVPKPESLSLSVNIFLFKQQLMLC